MEPSRPMIERRSPRRVVNVRAQYRRRVARLGAEVVDLSEHGLRLQSSDRLAVGEIVWVTLPGLEPRRAVVMWSEGFIAGCSFPEPLHPAVFDAVVERCGG
ncbi:MULTISPECIES: PilZ domain-containing protein [Novosphingobium]|uniref:PilZ domain-containing protein n=1 Tax=Novosphingobium TaxID=165696 RepID=UPI001CD691C8|nr:PilZ domain-containing protein [Novosphingobium percolationis]MCH7627946.1 PilZ domain-containing protein [Pseudomonadota bacterium]